MWKRRHYYYIAVAALKASRVSGVGDRALSEASTRRLLWWLLVATRGGPTRIKLLRAVMAKPLNAHQLAKELGMDYTTIRHHLEILLKHGLLEAVGENYGAIFYLSNWFTQNSELLKEILDENRKK